MPTPEARKVAVVSGGSSGIGLACAGVLLRRGYRVVLIARDMERLRRARATLDPQGIGLIECETADVGDTSMVLQAIDRIVARHDRIDWLVTSAGIVEPGLFRDLDLAAHRMQMETNYFGTLHLIQAILPIMSRNGGGRITLISSGAAFTGIAGYSGYAPGKFAVRALAEILRLELAADGVAVSVAIPPDTETPQLEQERPKRPLVTRLVSEQGGTMTAQRVAEKIIAQAEAGRFLLAPSLAMALLARFHSLYGPYLAWRQRHILRRGHGRERGR